MLFSDIIGLDETKKALVRSVQNNHVAHAQLFDGRAGGGALALAWAYAMYLNCENRQPTDSCGQCASCHKMKRLVHPDFHHIFPLPKASENLAQLTPQWREYLLQSPYRTLNDWLGFLKATGNSQGIIPIKEAHEIVSKISLKAFEGEYKILLIWQPELMNIESANALLKVLEEPPQKTIFLLVTSNTDKLLTTIISRTQRVMVRSFDFQEVVQYLENKGVEFKSAQKAAYLSEGNLLLATQLAQDTESDHHSWFATWMRTAYKADLAVLVKMADEFDEWHKEKQKELFNYSLRIFRDIILWQNQVGELIKLQDDERKFVENFGNNVSGLAIENLIEEVNQAFYHLERNARAKVMFLDISLTAARSLRK
jgi:DNA polymerase III subunit delta'